ncbi:hypothetical protein BASA62_008121 [Batrachochytrium salamandrivorans]|nr:hypothetical protein BASA62_008121 [Batrachochytrium salamandrivorans]
MLSTKFSSTKAPLQNDPILSNGNTMTLLIILGSKPLILLTFQSSTLTGLQYPLPIWRRTTTTDQPSKDTRFADAVKRRPTHQQLVERQPDFRKLGAAAWLALKRETSVW